MVHHVTLTMPDDLYQALLRRTQDTGRSLEETAADCLAQALQSPGTRRDPTKLDRGMGLRRTRCLGAAR